MAIPRMVVVNSGDGRLKKLVAKLKGGLPDEMREVAEVLHSATMDSFREERSPDGTPWPKLKQSTLERRVKSKKGTKKLTRAKKRGSSAGRAVALVGHLASAKMLQDKGTLRRGITPGSTPRTASVRVTGPAQKYARKQQFGDPDNRFMNTPSGAPAPVPARGFMPLVLRGGKAVMALPDKTRRRVREILMRGLRKAVNGG